MSKNVQNYHTIALLTCQYSNAKNSPSQAPIVHEGELPDVQAGFRKGRGTRDQFANIQWIIEKAREFQKNIYFCFIDYAKDFVDQNKLWKILKRELGNSRWKLGIPDLESKSSPGIIRYSQGNTRLPYLPPEKFMWVKKQQLELDMEQQTGSKLGKEYVKSVYCHPAYLTYMQSTSCKMPDWMKHKLESRLLGEISITSDTQITPPFWQKAKN